MNKFMLPGRLTLKLKSKQKMMKWYLLRARDIIKTHIKALANAIAFVKIKYIYYH